MFIKWMSIHFLDELFTRHSHCGRFEARIEEEKAVLQCETGQQQQAHVKKIRFLYHCLGQNWSSCKTAAYQGTGQLRGTK